MQSEKIIVKEGQSLFDIAVQEYGTVDAIFLLIEDNDFINKIDDNISPGDIIKIRPDDPLKEVATTSNLTGGIATIISADDINLGAFSSDFNNSYDVN